MLAMVDPTRIFCALALAVPATAQDVELETARSLLREIETATHSVARPEAARLVAIGSEGRSLPQAARQRLDEAFAALEDALLAEAYPEPLPEPDPESSEAPATARARNTHTSILRPFPSIRAIWTARRLLELGPEPSRDDLLADLGSGVFTRQRAAFEVLARDAERAAELAEPLGGVLLGRFGAWGPKAAAGQVLSPGGLAASMPFPNPPGSLRLTRLLAARCLVVLDPPSPSHDAAVELLLTHGNAEDRLVALRALSRMDGPVARLTRYRVIQLVKVREASDAELIAAVLALAAIGIPPEDEWPPSRSTMRRWLRRSSATEEQRLMAREVLAWKGATDADARPALEALAGDADRPRAARVARRVLERL